MTIRQPHLFIELAPRVDGVYEDARELTIKVDKQTGHELALALQRVELTTLHVPQRVRNLRLALDAELIMTPWIEGRSGSRDASEDTAH